MPKLIAFINILMVRKVKCILHSLYWCLPVGFWTIMLPSFQLK